MKSPAMLLLLLLLLLPTPALALDRASVAKALSASVALVTRKSGGAFCAGVLVRPLVVLTADHCVQSSVKAVGRTADEAADVKTSTGEVIQIVGVLKECIECDLALVILARVPRDAQPADVSTDVMAGDTVLVIGAPAGNEFTMSRGIISKIEQFAFQNCDDDKTGTKKQQVLVTDAMEYFGNSGGGLFNDEGKLIGIAVRLWTAEYPSVEGCGHAQDFIQVTMWGLAAGPAELVEFLKP